MSPSLISKKNLQKSFALHLRAFAVLSVRIVTSREDFPSRMFFLPLPATEEWGEDRGEISPDFLRALRP